MIDKILSYQETDANLRKIELELSGSEERKKAMSAKKYLDVMPESVNKLDLRASELSKAYESAIIEQKKLNEQQAELLKAVSDVSDENAGALLLKKAQELIGEIKALEESIKKLGTEISDIVKEYKNIKDTTKNAQEQYGVFGAKYNELKASKKGQMDDIKKTLLGLEKDIPKDLLERYKQKRADKIFPILFEVKDKTCGACNMEIPMSQLSELKNGKIIECDNCRRLLFKKEN
jgi:predicted  nucleic acid-binding Zn-ribbon protein